MKLIGIVGSNAEVSYNRKLLQYIEKQFHNLFDFEILEIKDVPLFNQSNDQTNSVVIQNISRKIKNADGVIIATPEHNHTIPAGLKSILEWLSFKIHPLENKPVMIVGASYYDQGSSRAQLHLRQILDAPGVNAIVMPGNEFLLGKVKEAFDENGDLKDQRTVDFLESCIQKFLKFISVVSALEEPKQVVLAPEDLYATGTIETTVEGVDMYADDWLEQATELVKPVEGNAYVKLDRGLLTVDQLNYLLASMPMEITYADSNNQFLYYNHTKPAEEMLASRYPGQVGNPLAKCHPEKAHKNVEWVIQQLRSGAMDEVRVHVPTHGPDKYVVHNYAAMHDKEGNYVGINEYIWDLKPLIDWYLEKTGQRLEGSADAVSGATAKAGKADAVSGASEKANTAEVVDAVSGASEKANTAEVADAVSGATAKH